MSSNDFLEARNYIINLEQILVESSNVTVEFLGKKSTEMAYECNMLKTPMDQKNYLDKYINYVLTLMEENGVEYQ